jgi:hypothetical protein
MTIEQQRETANSIYTDGDDAARWREIYRSLSGGAIDTLACLCKYGPTYDGNVPSKAGRDELWDKKLCARIVLKGCEFGYQAATYLGAHVWKAGQALKAAS